MNSFLKRCKIKFVDFFVSLPLFFLFYFKRLFISLEFFQMIVRSASLWREMSHITLPKQGSKFNIHNHLFHRSVTWHYEK